jgi:hypothetical protein
MEMPDTELQRRIALRALRNYEPGRDGGLRTVGEYRDLRGRVHTVGYLPSLAGTGLVVDQWGRKALLIDQLIGFDEREAQLIAVARDYLEQMTAHLDGARRHHPAPRAPVTRFGMPKRRRPARQAA